LELGFDPIYSAVMTAIQERITNAIYRAAVAVGGRDWVIQIVIGVQLVNIEG
jgi:hypothetical protein